MKIISHRGYWKSEAEKNRPVAFARSFDLGFGTETDVRDRNGDLVIAHDMAGAQDITLREFLDILAKRNLPLALNVKADGLSDALASLMRPVASGQWFTFDMSVPEMIAQSRHGLPVYTRASEYENPPVLYEAAQGIWLDGFHGEWYKANDISGFLADGKKVAVVGPELHKREPQPLWEMLKRSGLTGHPDLTLCTDLPEDAARYLGVVQ